MSIGGRGDWSNEGCSNATMNDELRSQDVVICKCNHLSTFGIFVVRNRFITTTFVPLLIIFYPVLQNTEPLTCLPGFVANPSLTDCDRKH